MSNSTDIPVNDTFNQIADVFLTTPSAGSDSSAPEDLRYPLLTPDHDNACDTTNSVTASVNAPAIGTHPARPSSPKSADFSALHLTPTDEQFVGAVAPACGTNDDCDDYPDDTGEDDYSRTFAQVDNNPSRHADTESNEQATTPDINLSLLYACHLPVQGRLWYGQLAAAIAAEFGSTCFLRRLGEDAVSADLFPAHSHDEESRTSLSEAVTLRESDNTAEGIIRSAIPFTKHWLIHVQHFAELTRSGAGDELTPNRIILATSADPAAMVGVYKTLKNIISIWGANTAITLLFIGADHESARGAFNRIASAAQGFLNRTISCLAVLPKMEPVRMTHLGVFPYRESAAHPDGFINDMSQIIHDDNVLAITRAEDEEASYFDGEMIDPNEEDNLNADDRDDTPEPKQDAVIEATGFGKDDRTAPPQLVSIIPELTDLIARSPKAPEVELAIDTDGCVHALYTDTHDETSYCEEDGNPVACLLSVCDWIENHSSVIRLLRSFPVSQSSEMKSPPKNNTAPPNITAPPTNPPPTNTRPLRTQAHLFTAHPQQYRRLMDGRLRIHLLAPVEEIAITSENENTDHHDAKRRQMRWVHVPVN